LMKSQLELKERRSRGEAGSAAKEWAGKKLQTPSTKLHRNFKIQNLEVAAGSWKSFVGLRYLIIAKS
jgi:hypothetical protein